MPTTSAAYPPEYFERQNEEDDRLFYLEPRFVTHIDDGALKTLTALLDELLKPHDRVLDLMSSWRTHLPDDFVSTSVTGIGLNAAEMADNPQLTTYEVQNLNHDPLLPYGGDSFDAVLCTVSVQYMIKPLELFGEVNRVLKPGGVFVVSFSNRCFPEKAINAWTYSGGEDHLGLVNSYFQLSGNWVDPHVRLRNPPDGDRLFMMWAFKHDGRLVDAATA